MKEEEEKKIKNNVLEAVKKSGYPLEIEVSTMLDKMLKDWFVNNTCYYFDYEENKGRDLDINACATEVLNGILLFCDLVIECKKSDDIWVFFTRPKGTEYPSQQITDTLFLNEGKKTTCANIIERAGLHYNQTKDMAIAYDVVKGNKTIGGHSIFEAINQISKFMEYQLLLEAKSWGIPGAPEGNIIYAFIPIIVFDGLLYKVKLDKGIDLEKIDAITLTTSRRVGYCPDRALPIYIDIVTKDAFFSLIEVIKQDYEKLKKYILSDTYLKEAKNKFH